METSQSTHKHRYSGGDKPEYTQAQIFRWRQARVHTSTDKSIAEHFICEYLMVFFPLVNSLSLYIYIHIHIHYIHTYTHTLHTYVYTYTHSLTLHTLSEFLIF